MNIIYSQRSCLSYTQMVHYRTFILANKYGAKCDKMFYIHAPKAVWIDVSFSFVVTHFCLRFLYVLDVILYNEIVCIQFTLH